jgi:hypothetical protein
MPTRAMLCDLVGLRPLLPLNDIELNRVTSLQRLEALTLDGRVMNEDISSAVLADEAVSLAIVEPLYPTLKSSQLLPPSCAHDEDGGANDLLSLERHTLGISGEPEQPLEGALRELVE